MKLGGGRIKGSTFERKIAGMVVRAFAPFGITKKDCYRTPLSGGHIHAKHCDPGDLVCSPELRVHFSYSVECKKYAKLDWAVLLSDKAKKGHWEAWWKQACVAAAFSNAPPLLVFSANRSEPFVLSYLKNITDICALKGVRPYLRTSINGSAVIVFRFSRLLDILSYIAHVHKAPRTR